MPGRCRVPSPMTKTMFASPTELTLAPRVGAASSSNARIWGSSEFLQIVCGTREARAEHRGETVALAPAGERERLVAATATGAGAKSGLEVLHL